MKKLPVMLLALALASAAAFAVTTTEADQRWLSAVEKMVQEGKTQISTASEERLALAKNWAATQGYETQVTRIGQSYQVTFSKTKSLTKK
jgi:hypothetical protein